MRQIWDIFVCTSAAVVRNIFLKFDTRISRQKLQKFHVTSVCGLDPMPNLFFMKYIESLNQGNRAI